MWTSKTKYTGSNLRKCPIDNKMVALENPILIFIINYNLKKKQKQKVGLHVNLVQLIQIPKQFSWLSCHVTYWMQDQKYEFKIHIWLLFHSKKYFLPTGRYLNVHVQQKDIFGSVKYASLFFQ